MGFSECTSYVGETRAECRARFFPSPEAYTLEGGGGGGGFTAPIS